MFFFLDELSCKRSFDSIVCRHKLLFMKLKFIWLDSLKLCLVNQNFIFRYFLPETDIGNALEGIVDILIIHNSREKCSEASEAHFLSLCASSWRGNGRKQIKTSNERVYISELPLTQTFDMIHDDKNVLNCSFGGKTKTLAIYVKV